MNAFASLPAGGQPFRAPPQNVEMEQALLGSILLNNDVFGAVAGIVSVDDFSEELHRRIFQVATDLISAGQTATPLTLKTFLGDHDLGHGVNLPLYLVRLRGESQSPLQARDYAINLRDLAVRRRLIGVLEEAANQAYDMPVSCKPAQIGGEAIAALHAIIAADGSIGTRREAHQAAATTIDNIRRAAEGSTKSQKVSTGFSDLDRATGGYQPGTLWVVAARPGMGKTIYFATSANKVARRGWGVKGFSLEVPERQMLARALADLAFSSRRPISFARIMEAEHTPGVLTPEEVWQLEDAQRRLAGMPLIIDVASRLTPAEIRVRVRSERERMASAGVELKVIFLDYLKQIQASDRYRGNRVYEVGEISYSLKQLAKDEGICVVLLAQLNRALEGREDKRPGLADLRESGDLETDADVVAFIHREAQYILQSADYREGNAEAINRFLHAQHKAQIILGKNRAGPTRPIDVWCDVACSTMSDHVLEACP